MKWFRLKECKKCGGDLALDDGDWLCLQCGSYYYTRLYQQAESPRGKWMNWPPLSQREKGAGVVNNSPDSARKLAPKGTYHGSRQSALLAMSCLFLSKASNGFR